MRRIVMTAAAAMFAGALFATADSLNSYTQTNLVSDLPNVAAQQDPGLVNPWGIVAGPSSPFWISDNGSGLSTLYNGSGNKVPLTVTIPPAGSSPTGIVFNSGSSFGGAHFIFATEDGTIAGWTSGSLAVINVPGATGSVYKGLAEGNNGSADFLYAANFGTGKIDVFDSNFNSATLPGGFADPNVPAGFAPFNIENIDGKLYVTYAKQDSMHHDDVPGAGNGFVDVFDLNGNLLQRLASGNALNSPWGLALAPSAFGAFSGDLLVGNFGDGTINAYDASNGNFMGTLDGTNGSPITIMGLWGLSFGNGAQGQQLDDLYFTAGIPGPNGAIEDHGLFGSLAVATPEPQPAFLLGFAGLGWTLVVLVRRRAQRGKAQLG